RILHIATHGFFLPDQPADTTAESRALSHREEPERAAPKREQENPLLRSGIVLAGVKQQQSGLGEDGVLTALEAAGLDLWGTQLVVLSACETGLGEVRNGAGVYGLRRALVLAGSETQVMSLWSVNDESTRDLMVGFYKRLQTGEGRAEALRNVQLEMLGTNASQQPAGTPGARPGAAAQRFSHPYFWAPFIESGAWTSTATPAR
ncbi:MAG TPA: CHAT domain-containing protein, partial [Blastocatellia bacterium]|nr:CHAT domain-containing protein [Blastocatellia bacterium]